MREYLVLSVFYDRFLPSILPAASPEKSVKMPGLFRKLAIFQNNSQLIAQKMTKKHLEIACWRALPQNRQSEKHVSLPSTVVTFWHSVVKEDACYYVERSRKAMRS